MERLDVAGGEVGRERLERLAALVHRERQLGGADLGQVVGEAEPLQPQTRVGPGRDHDAQRARPVVEQRLQLPVDDRALDLVEVVEDEHDRLGTVVDPFGDPGDEPFAGRPAAQGAGVRERALDPNPEARAPVVVAVEREPGDAARRGGSRPRGEEHGLPRSRVCRDERHEPLRAALDQLMQPGTLHEPRRRGRRDEFRGRKRHDGTSAHGRLATGGFDGNRMHRPSGVVGRPESPGCL